MYRYHSGYEGGLREERAKDVRAAPAARLVEEAVHGMLPKTKMGDADVPQAESVRSAPIIRTRRRSPSHLEVA